MGFLDNFNIKTKYGALAVTATPIIIIGGIYMAWAYTRKAWTRKPVLARSMSIGVLHGGKLALERLVQAHLDAQSLNDAEVDLKDQLEMEKPNFKKLQTIIARLEMSGKEAEAVKILKEKRDKAKGEKKPHEAYEIEILLVEMLIYRGNFQEANECDCLTHKQITDARRPLYRAIIHIMLERSESEAKDFWNQFNQIRNQFEWPNSLQDSFINEVLGDFEKFKAVVNCLKMSLK